MGKTNFRPQADGFAFVNAWKFSLEEDDQIKQTLTHSANNVSPGDNGGLVNMAKRILKPVLRKWTKDSLPEYYGLCGGMACAALDYYQVKTPMPRGSGHNDLPTSDTPEGQALRSYLLRRQLESMALNFPKLLFWMGVQHVDLPFIQDDGPRWLLNRSREEWQELKGHINGGSPWPLMLVGSSTDPFHNHQVLAYGYEQKANQIGVIYVYDMNCPDAETTITIDFGQQVLEAQESCADAARGPLRGFFCNIYHRADPPATAAVSHQRA